MIGRLRQLSEPMLRQLAGIEKSQIPVERDVLVQWVRKSSPRSHPRHLVGKRTAQKDTIKDITNDSQVNSYFPYRWSPASLTLNTYLYLFLYLYITRITINFFTPYLKSPNNQNRRAALGKQRYDPCVQTPSASTVGPCRAISLFVYIFYGAHKQVMPPFIFSYIVNILMEQRQ